MEVKYGELWFVVRHTECDREETFGVGSGKEGKQGWCNIIPHLNLPKERFERIVQCQNACSGLDMSNVPAFAVRELVEALKLIASCQHNYGQITIDDIKHIAEKALAPFKE